jgi:hypothetical protein
MAPCEFRDELQNIDTVEAIEEFIAMPIPKPDEKTPIIAQIRRAARQSEPPLIAQMLIMITEKAFARIVQMLGGDC